jgi:hypothetical protein
MLIRIAGIKRYYTYSLYAASAILTLVNLVALFYIIFRCSPVRYVTLLPIHRKCPDVCQRSFAWDTSTPGGHCQPSRILTDIYYAATTINIVFDYFCSILPIPLLWTLQMNLNAKLTVGFLLSLGVLASLSACVRLKYTVALNSADDYLYSIADVVIWGYAEVGVGFFVACLATLRPLFRKIIDLRAESGKQAGTKEGQHSGAVEMQRPAVTYDGNQGRRWESKIIETTISEEALVPGVDERGIVVSRSILQSSNRKASPSC